MAELEVRFHSAAVDEARAARLWYEARSPAAAAAFLAELDQAVDQVREAPARWPTFGGTARRYLFRRFPFMLVYRDKGAALEVLAVAHARRRPG